MMQKLTRIKRKLNNSDIVPGDMFFYVLLSDLKAQWLIKNQHDLDVTLVHSSKTISGCIISVVNDRITVMCDGKIKPITIRVQLDIPFIDRKGLVVVEEIIKTWEEESKYE